MEDLLKELAKELTEAGPQRKKAARFTHEKEELVKVIETLEESVGQNLPEEDIIKRANEKGIGEEETKRLINELLRDGFLYRPHYMTGIVRIHGVSDYTQWSHDFPV